MHSIELGNAKLTKGVVSLRITADSTTFAEYVATNDHTGCQRILWSKNILGEMGFHPQIIFHQDNTSTIHLRILKYSGDFGRTKHIALPYSLIRETIKAHNIQMVYNPSEEMVADIFTKSSGMRLFPIQQCAILGNR